MLVHQDAEIVDADLCADAPRGAARPRRRRGRLRRRARRAQHRLVGGLGDARRRSSTATRSTAAATCPRSRGLGGGAGRTRSTGEVETLDGFVLVLSPWAVRNVRFDESLGRFHGYDLDFCLQVREAGRKVVTADFRAIHHRSLEMLPDPEEWIEAHIARGGEVGRPHAARRHRAGRLARARAARRGRARRRARAARTRRCVELEARARELRRGIAETRGSMSWRLTAPLRLRRRRRRRDDRLRLPVIADAEAYRRFAAARASGAPPSPTRRSTCSRRSGSICRGYNLILDRSRRRATTSRRSCSSTRTPRSPTPTSAPRSARRCADPDVGGRRAASARAASAASPGGTARSARRRSCTATASTAAASWTGYGWAPPAGRRRRGRRRRRLPARAVAVGGAQRCASTSRSRPATASTSTSACRLRAGRPQGRHRRPARDPPPLARAGRGPRGLGRGPHRPRREVGRPLARARRRGRPTGSDRARRAEAEREAARDRRLLERDSRLDAEVLALERELAAMTGHARRWRLTAPLRLRLNRGDATSSSARRTSSREITDCRCATPARMRSRDSRSATANALDSSIRRSSASCSARRSRSPTARAGLVHSREVVDAVGLEPLEHRVAVPRVEDARRARPTTARRACQTTPKPKNTGTTTSRSRSRLGDEVLDRGEHAVARAALARGRARVGQAAGGASPARRGTARPSPACGGWRASGGIARRRSSRRAARAASTTSWKSSSGSSAPGARSPISRSSSRTVK